MWAAAVICLAAAVGAGYDAPIGTITLNSPAATGAFAGDPRAVEIIVQENLPTLFTSLFMDGDVPMSGRAVARLTEGRGTCILALDPDAPRAIEFTGDSDSILVNCNVHANSLAIDAITVIGSAHVEAPCVSTMGNVSASSGLVMGECTSPIEHADKIYDPYASLPEPGTDDPCEPETVFGGPQGSIHPITGGRYCGELILTRIVNMAAGVYVIDGEGDPDNNGLRIESQAEVRGTGVTFYLINGANIHIAGGADVQVSAPTDGTYAGILFFVGRGEDSSYYINGGSSSALIGAIYAPNGLISLEGTSSVDGGGCTQVVARRIRIAGTNQIGTNCTGTGVIGIETEQLVMLVE